MREVLKKITPPAIRQPIRRAIVASRDQFFPRNPWWSKLEKIRNCNAFPELTEIARRACKEIREAYVPILKKNGVDSKEFFWGSIKDADAEMLYQLVLDRKPKVAYQIGTFVGYSALVIADALRANGGGILLAVDPEVPHRTFVNPVDVAREMAKARGLDKYIRFERGWHCVVSGDYISMGLKRRIPIVGAQVLDSVRKQGVDLAFIDGDHSTASTLADFLLLRDYLNVNGIAVFHDAQSWPTVAQALFIMWHDNFYYRSNTARYFAIDVCAGNDGLGILQRIRDESRPTLCLTVVNKSGQPIPNVKIEIPSANLTIINGKDGKMYVEDEFPSGVVIKASCHGYRDYAGKLDKGTEGDFAENTIVLSDA
ncbi:MAG: class I SAM-dependent methyltransferase [Hyphomicrobiales bacterium]|nr:class I SAM-dependent methyltransferase [Hyphomicrobiales bacterium]